MKPEHLNDSRIGRVLDQLYKKGLTHVFIVIALAAVKRFEVSIKQAHLDSSSFCVQGEYLHSQQEADSAEVGSQEQSSRQKDSAKEEAEDSAEPMPIEITYGYSRDHRPDLKQFTRSADYQWRWRCATVLTSG